MKKGNLDMGGNSYYVGTCGITAILVAGKEGHILIDGGTKAGADVIAENINDLGFSLRDVKILLPKRLYDLCGQHFKATE